MITYSKKGVDGIAPEPWRGKRHVHLPIVHPVLRLIARCRDLGLSNAVCDGVT